MGDIAHSFPDENGAWTVPFDDAVSAQKQKRHRQDDQRCHRAIEPDQTARNLGPAHQGLTGQRPAGRTGQTCQNEDTRDDQCA